MVNFCCCTFRLLMQSYTHNGNIVQSLSKEDYNVLLKLFSLLNGIVTVTILFPVNYLQSHMSLGK